MSNVAALFLKLVTQSKANVGLHPVTALTYNEATDSFIGVSNTGTITKYTDKTFSTQATGNAFNCIASHPVTSKLYAGVVSHGVTQEIDAVDLASAAFPMDNYTDWSFSFNGIVVTNKYNAQSAYVGFFSNEQWQGSMHFTGGSSNVINLSPLSVPPSGTTYWQWINSIEGNEAVSNSRFLSIVKLTDTSDAAVWLKGTTNEIYTTPVTAFAGSTLLTLLIEDITLLCTDYNNKFIYAVVRIYTSGSVYHNVIRKYDIAEDTWTTVYSFQESIEFTAITHGKLSSASTLVLVDTAGNWYALDTTTYTITSITSIVSSIGYTTYNTDLTVDSINYTAGQLLGSIETSNSLDISQGKGGNASAIEGACTLGDPDATVAEYFKSLLGNNYITNAYLYEIRNLNTVPEPHQLWALRLSEVIPSEGEVALHFRSASYFDNNLQVRNISVPSVVVDPVDPLNPTIPLNALTEATNTNNLPITVYDAPPLKISPKQSKAGYVYGSRNVSIPCTQTSAPQKICFYGYPGMLNSPVANAEFIQGNLDSGGVTVPTTKIQSVASRFHAPYTVDSYTGGATPTVAAAYLDFEMYFGNGTVPDYTTLDTFTAAITALVDSGYKIVLGDGTYSLDMECVGSWSMRDNTGDNGFAPQKYGHYNTFTQFRQNGRLVICHMEQKSGSTYTPFRLLRCVLSDDYLGDGSASHKQFVPRTGLDPSKCSLYAIPAGLTLTATQNYLRGFATVTGEQEKTTYNIEGTTSVVGGINVLHPLDTGADGYTCIEEIENVNWAVYRGSLPGRAYRSGWAVDPVSPATLSLTLISGKTSFEVPLQLNVVSNAIGYTYADSNGGGLAVSLAPVVVDSKSYDAFFAKTDAEVVSSYTASISSSDVVEVTTVYYGPGTDPVSDIRSSERSKWSGTQVPSVTSTIPTINTTSKYEGMRWDLASATLEELQRLRSPQVSFEVKPGMTGRIQAVLKVFDAKLFGMKKISVDSPHAVVYPYAIGNGVDGANSVSTGKGIVDPFTAMTFVVGKTDQGLVAGTNMPGSYEMIWERITGQQVYPDLMEHDVCMVEHTLGGYIYVYDRLNAVLYSSYVQTVNGSLVMTDSTYSISLAIQEVWEAHGTPRMFSRKNHATATAPGELVFSFPDGTLVLATIMIGESSASIDLATYLTAVTGLTSQTTCINAETDNTWFGTIDGKIARLAASTWSTLAVPDVIAVTRSATYGNQVFAVKHKPALVEYNKTLTVFSDLAYTLSTEHDECFGLAASGAHVVQILANKTKDTATCNNVYLRNITCYDITTQTFTPVRSQPCLLAEQALDLLYLSNLPTPIWFAPNSNNVSAPGHIQTLSESPVVWMCCGVRSAEACVQTVQALSGSTYGTDVIAGMVNRISTEDLEASAPKNGLAFGITADENESAQELLTKIAVEHWLVCGDMPILSVDDKEVTGDNGRNIANDMMQTWLGDAEQVVTELVIDYAPWAGSFTKRAFITNTQEEYDDTKPSTYYYAGWDELDASGVSTTTYGRTLWDAFRVTYKLNGTTNALKLEYSSVHEPGDLGSLMCTVGIGGKPRYAWMTQRPRFVRSVCNGNQGVSPLVYSGMAYKPDLIALELRTAEVYPEYGIAVAVNHEFTQGVHEITTMFPPE